MVARHVAGRKKWAGGGCNTPARGLPSEKGKAMTTATRTRKPRQVVRTVKLNLTPFDGNPGTLTIRVANVIRDYFVRPIPSDFGKGFLLEKMAPEGDEPESYDVKVSGRDGLCGCKGHARHGHCKHVQSLQALVNLGKL
jgi:hypothetical protein